MLKKTIEKILGETFKGVFIAVNPIKKKIIKTYCIVHKFINIQALEILKNEKRNEAYEFYKKYIKYINEGATFADQDFKSSNHFYHVDKKKGLYGFSDALSEFKKYYNKAISYYKTGDTTKGMFYLGAALHLSQDATVPQHVSNKLLKQHRKFEQWIISRLLTDYSFEAVNGIVRYKTIDEYVKNNAEFAFETSNKYKNIVDEERRYHDTATEIIIQAQRTTAGILLDFYENEV